MGNTLSSEAVPQRLSKPRPQFDLPTNLVPPPDFASCREFDNRYRHCYLAASRPLLHLNLPSPGQDAALDSRPPSPVSAHCLSWQPLDAIEPSLTKSSLNRRLSRANSVVCQTGAGVCSVARSHRSASDAAQSHLLASTDLGTSSVQGNGNPLYQKSPIVMESRPQSFRSNLLRRRQNSCPPIQISLPTSTSSQTHDSESQPSLQGSPTRSSSFIPVRQRSLYLTPGVATRNVRDNPSSPTKPLVRIGPPIAEAKDSCDSFSSSSDHHPGLPLMVPPSGLLESQYRPVTPCEANYRQLGGIKFGTLRITNGSPVPSPAAESDEDVSRRCPVQSPTSTAKDGVVPNTSVTSVYESEVSASRQGSISSSTGHGVARPMPSPPISPTTHRRQSSPRVAEKRLADEFMSPEVLDIRDDPHAKPQAHRHTARPSATNQDDSVARSDSGFASTSTSSRNSSQRTVSKADSGFSSSFSLPSIQSDCVLSTPENAPGAGSLSSQCTSPKDVEVVMEEGPGRMPRWRGSQSTRSAISSMSREVIRRLSNRSSKSFKSLSLEGVQTSAAQDGASWPAFNDADNSQEAAVFASLDRKPEKQGRLLRLLSGGKKQTSADVYLPSYSVPDCAPAVPVNLREKLHTRIGHMSTVPKKDFRPDPNHQPLQTIMSVESLPLEQANEEAVDQVGMPPPPPLPAKSPRFNPLASAASLSPKMLIRRKPIGSGPKTASKTAVASSPLTRANAAAEPPAYQHALFSRTSMPDMAASFKTRPLPPVPQQPRVRTVRTARDMLPSQAVPDAVPGRREPPERYRWMPAPGKKPEVMVSEHPQPRRLGPPVVCRQAQLRQYHDDQGRQQYRTLYSYSSSAYRNMPISS